MYDKEMEDEIRETEIALGNPPNRGVARRLSQAQESEGRPLFVVETDFCTGEVKFIPVGEE